MTLLAKTILYVDDDIDDMELLGEAMHQVAPELTVTYAENGLLALELLKKIKETKSLPSLIILDLNMPYLNGRQTFEQIKADPQLKDIPLVILSSGHSPADKLMFSKAGIPYFTKPVDFDTMKRIASHMAGLCF